MCRGKKCPAVIIDAVLAIEDRNFFTHHGVDVKAMLRALWRNLKAGGVRQGASTITQQVVKNYSLTSKRTLQRKLKEIFLALELERILPKEKILNIYLNNFFLGNRSYGVGCRGTTLLRQRYAAVNPGGSGHDCWSVSCTGQV